MKHIFQIQTPFHFCEINKDSELWYCSLCPVYSVVMVPFRKEFVGFHVWFDILATDSNVVAISMLLDSDPSPRFSVLYTKNRTPRWVTLIFYKVAEVLINKHFRGCIVDHWTFIVFLPVKSLLDGFGLLKLVHPSSFSSFLLLLISLNSISNSSCAFNLLAVNSSFPEDKREMMDEQPNVRILPWTSHKYLPSSSRVLPWNCFWDS